MKKNEITPSKVSKYVIEKDIPIGGIGSHQEEIEMIRAMKINESFKFPIGEANKFASIRNCFNARGEEVRLMFRKVDSYNMRLFKVSPDLPKIKRPRN